MPNPNQSYNTKSFFVKRNYGYFTQIERKIMNHNLIIIYIKSFSSLPEKRYRELKLQEIKVKSLSCIPEKKYLELEL